MRKARTPPIKASVKIMGRVYTAKGKTVIEAITNLKPDIARGISILSLERGDTRKERILSAGITMRLFGPASRVGKEVALKQASQVFAGAF